MNITDLQNTYITSDHHFKDTRFDVLYRDVGDDFLIKEWNLTVPENATVIHLGDFSVNEDGYRYTQYLNGEIHLIKGNYDEPHSDEFLFKYFTSVRDNLTIEVEGYKLYLNHYPDRARSDVFNIVGHIHGLWKVQPNMINVGIDAWHYRPVKFTQLMFTLNAVKNFYDNNVFAGRLEANNKTML